MSSKELSTVSQSREKSHRRPHLGDENLYFLVYENFGWRKERVGKFKVRKVELRS